jgi:hypothetical protein
MSETKFHTHTIKINKYINKIQKVLKTFCTAVPSLNTYMNYAQQKTMYYRTAKKHLTVYQKVNFAD